MSLRLAFSAAVLLAATSAPAAPAPAPAVPNAAGTWDLVWQTRKGPSKRGWLVIRQNGTQLRAEIHGQGQVKVKGTLTGSDFALRGSRFAVPYVISGRISGERLDGSLRVLSVRRVFTGTRRSGS